MQIPIYIVDAFAEEPFHGNPAAVCLLQLERPDAWMQSMAQEMNLSETAFLTVRGPNSFNLRWMTPTVEVDLCGHATLASAHILFSERLADPKIPISFSTRSGVLTAVIGTDRRIELDFPAIETSPLALPSNDLLEAFDCEILAARKGAFDFLLEVGSETVLRNLRPDFARLRRLDVRGVVVTCIADPGKSYDFASRGFFPNSGIDEDPVTGSAHCMLGPYWMKKLGNARMTGYQASKRGGYIKLHVEGERVKLAGSAVAVVKGHLFA